jgi:hypothetical protein
MLSTTRKVLGFAIAFLFIFFSVPALFLLPAETILFQPIPYINALQDQNIYQDIPAWLAGVAVNNGNNGSGGTQAKVLSSLGEPGYQNIFSVLMPQDWLKSQTDNLITNLWDYLNFKQTTLTLDIDLREVKTRFKGAQGQTIAKEIVSSWPACSPEQLLGIITQLAQGNNLADIPLCQPPEMYLPLTYQLVQVSLSGFTGALPDQLNLMSVISVTTNGDPTQSSAWQQTFQYYKLLRLGLRVLPVLSFILLLLLAIITFRSARTGWSWLGITILLTGIFGLITAGILFLSGNLLVQQAVSAVFGGAPAGLITAVINAIKEVTDRFYLWSAGIALMTAILGVILFVISRLFKAPVQSY